MKRYPPFRQIAANPKLKYWLCGVGVIVIMSVLASMPSITKNSFTGSKPATATKRVSGHFNFSGGQVYVQTAGSASQGNSSVVQGSAPLVVPAVQDVVPAQDITPPIDMPPVCAHQTMYPRFNGCDRLLCPQAVSNSCSGCGALLSACLIE